MDRACFPRAFVDCVFAVLATSACGGGASHGTHAASRSPHSTAAPTAAPIAAPAGAPTGIPAAVPTAMPAAVPNAAWPTDCEQRWQLDQGSIACQRKGQIDVLSLVDGTVHAVYSVPNTTIYDVSSEEGLVIAGPCGHPDENAANAVCIVPPPAAPGTRPVLGTVYLSGETASEPGFPRGVVATANHVLATNGRTFDLSNYHNKDNFTPVDVQARLAATHLKPKTCAQWPVLEPFHRDGSEFVIVFKDCAGHPVRVTVGFADDDGALELRRQKTARR